MQRAAAVRADFAANGDVAEICRRLDCLPLAIELAAARVKALASPALLERLEQRLPLLAGGSRSAPERQRTLRATIAWSHDLLTAAEQELFARLAVFAGGCTLEAAEQICGADLDGIASLVDKSLLRRSGDRYWMLETIREFASERLDQLADVERAPRPSRGLVCRTRRARASGAARAGSSRVARPPRRGARERAGFPRAPARERGRGRCAAAVGAIWLYWQTRGHWTEGRRFLTAAVALGADLEPERLVDSLWGGALLALWQGDTGEGEQLASRMLEISRTAAEQEHVYSVAIHMLAIVADRRGDRDQALALLEESVALGRGGGDQWLLSIALNNLGDMLAGEGDYERAAALFEESLVIGEARGDLDRRARALTNLGWATHGLGDLARARDYYRRGLEAATEIGLVEMPALVAVRHRRAGSRGRRRPHGSSSARPNEGTGVSSRCCKRRCD